MKRAIIPLCLTAALLLLADCAGSPQRGDVANGVGSTFETAIILDDASTEGEGVRAEHAWVKKNMPGWRWGTQSLVNRDGRVYDVIELHKDGATKDLYFDISDWFGKLD